MQPSKGGSHENKNEPKGLPVERFFIKELVGMVGGFKFYSGFMF